MPIRLSVNLNKVCLLRNSRGGRNPAPIVAGRACLDAGASGLTLHWRADERHTRKADVRELRALCAERGAEFNLEGDARAELIDLAEELAVTQFTLVPVKPGEVTSDHGWDLPRQHDVVAPIMARLNARSITTEIYTEPYAAAFGTPSLTTQLDRVRETARAAVAAGMEVNAGHDLDLRNLPLLARQVPEIAEASIGHALIADALYLGFAETVHRYVRACHGDAVDAPVTK
jgi:pyridoxine 5-phosphate synthase